jgi:predicted O-methyltransferase YrrM
VFFEKLLKLMKSRFKSLFATFRSRGYCPWLLGKIDFAVTLVRWTRQRWDLRGYDAGEWIKFSDDPEKLVRWVFESNGGALAPLQLRAELIDFAKLVNSHSPQTVLELGTARGGTFLALCRMSSDEALIISVDLPFGRGGGGYPKWKEPILRSFAKPLQTIELLRADSHLDQTVEQVRNLLGDRQFDLIFIDADHSYTGALRDFEMYSQLVRPGGLICMHDVVHNPASAEIEVDRVWSEVADGMDFQVIRDPSNFPGYGIGVIRKALIKQ